MHIQYTQLHNAMLLITVIKPTEINTDIIIFSFDIENIPNLEPTDIN
jgi:hypothetical protein